MKKGDYDISMKDLLFEVEMKKGNIYIPVKLCWRMLDLKWGEKDQKKRMKHHQLEFEKLMNNGNPCLKFIPVNTRTLEASSV